MKKFAILIFFASFSLFSAAFAANFNNIADAEVISTGGNNGSNFGSQTTLTAAQSCISSNQTNLVYVKFELSSIGSEISSATSTSNLTINISNPGSGATPGNLKVYGVTNDGEDNWTETGVTYDSRPTTYTELISTPVSGLTTGLNNFTSAAFVTYLNDQTSSTQGGDSVSGNDIASLVIGIENCSGVISTVIFDSKEGGTGPALNLFNPTAVKLGTIESSTGREDRLIWIISGLGMALAASLLIVQRFKKDPLETDQI